jgi:hypothetical protein
MIQNPFLTVPQVESPASRSWASGFLFGFQGPEQSTFAQADVPTEDRDAFNLGVLAGQSAAINGLEFTDTCVDLAVERPSGPHFAADATTEGIFTLFGIAKLGLHVAGLAAEGIIAVVMLSIALQTFSDDPDVAISQRAQRLQSSLSEMGITSSMELFLGGGVDISVSGCELKVTRIFRGQAAATEAAKAVGRDHWLVVTWRTDQSGGIRVVDSNTQ